PAPNVIVPLLVITPTLLVPGETAPFTTSCGVVMNVLPASTPFEAITIGLGVERLAAPVSSAGTVTPDAPTLSVVTFATLPAAPAQAGCRSSVPLLIATTAVAPPLVTLMACTVPPLMFNVPCNE